jgi:hypothetical protein
MQMQKAPLVAALFAAIALASCATAPTAEITRFHLGGPIPSDTIRVVASTDPVAPGTMVPLEFRSYVAVISRDLAARGFRPVESGPSAYLAILVVQQTTRAGIPQSAPFRIGIGGGGGSGNVGLGGGFSIPVGTPRNTDIRVNMVGLRIRRESDSTAVWEGRAVQEVPARASGASLTAAVPALSSALLSEFPGESGRTVIVKLR